MSNLSNVFKIIRDVIPNKKKYSILEFDVMMKEMYSRDGEPMYSLIKNYISENNTGYTTDINIFNNVIDKIYDVMDFVVVINDEDLFLRSNSFKDKDEFLGESFIQIIINDGELIDIICQDKYLESKLKSNFSSFPFWIND